MSRNATKQGSTKQGSTKGKGKGKGNASPVRPVVVAGRGKIVDVLNAKELQGERDRLIEELRNATERNDKKRLRRMLRTRGHFGGLGIMSARIASRESA